MIRAFFLLLSIANLALPTLSPAHAQSAPIELQGAESAYAGAIPRTADGHPDFGGRWAATFITGISRMPGATALVASDAEAKKLSAGWIAMANSPQMAHSIDPDFFVDEVDTLSKVNGEWRTSLITTGDGAQHYTEEGKRLDARRKAWNTAPADGYEMRSQFERCFVGVGGAPFTSVPATLLREFVQTPDHIVLATETNDTRIVSIGGEPKPSAITTLLGDSIGRWEGDVLVVETTNVRERLVTDMIIRPQSRVVERFEMLGADEMLYRFTVEDAGIYAQPWSAEYVLHRSTLPMFEYACHEANYGLVNILQAGRMAKDKPKAKAPPKRR